MLNALFTATFIQASAHFFGLIYSEACKIALPASCAVFKKWGIVFITTIPPLNTDLRSKTSLVIFFRTFER